MKRRILILSPTAIILSTLLLVVMALPVAALVDHLQEPHSGIYEMYSGRGNKLNNTLTQEITLPPGTVEMKFWTWYDIQTHWDYGYVEFSTDGGYTWGMLESTITTRDNPNGNNDGSGITGNSSDISGNINGWILASFDLTNWDDQTILFRFRYETDKSIHHPGWAIDDIEITGSGLHDFETGLEGWITNGWSRVNWIYDTEGAIDDAVGDVEDLVNGGTLPEGQGKSLAKKLQLAKTMLAEDKTIPAINQLNAFISQVQSLINSGALTEQEGQDLIDAANDIISAILY